ncbi:MULTISPECIES: MCE family protein [Streptomyces]|uniref:MCE family protein n=1 Tax=Streptomyces glycanivorans TaxID=3033808 RepID=A0ABY9J8Y9_9ACTN|nr:MULTISPECIES: MCE family protein [unclassified Streptomyces]TXS13268.1 MCE family protein [Streptomyces sp. wa22]WLQ62758.1 MCE family protein [Streptomyces sp. Alt3]WSQ83518.1 MCE family protein [Streptomyces sp. NBC_01212]WSR10452.1 MCE family protein [Streptomyces sp. NBC_01208]WSR46855.1 MCE family protein [Streptomyces sp. NBC_01201]
MTPALRRPGTRAVAGLGALVAAGVCFALVATTTGLPSFSGIDQMPLPGGADLGDHPYEITAEFGDVLSLAPQSSVKVNDVAVGRVTRISLTPGSWTAKVTMRVNGKIQMPANAYAHLEQSSLLGEKYVQLSPPADGTAKGTLSDGDRIPLVRTNRNPEVEEVFGALSMLLNGGGIAQLKTITTELNKALAGQEPQIRSMLSRVDTLVTDLDTHKEDITDALDGVNRLAATLATRKQDVGTVLTGLSPGLKVLEKQRGSLLTMLRSLDTLSTVAVDTVNRSKADMIADLKALAPTLTALADSGKDLPDSLQVLLTYPFTDEVLRGVKGDYLNVYLDVTAVPGTQIIPALTEPEAGTTQRSGSSLPLPLPSVTASGTEGTS